MFNKKAVGCAVAAILYSFSAFGQEKELTDREKLIQLEADKIRLQKKISELEKSAHKKESPEERKAREIVAKREKHDESEQKKNTRALRNAAITGCSGGVTVDRRATGGWSFQSYAKVRATNLHSMPIDISDESGVVVHNLCAGGQITLFREIKVFIDSNVVNYQYTAIGKFPDGNIGTQQSQSFYLSQYNSDQVGQFYTWQDQLQKHIPQR